MSSGNEEEYLDALCKQLYESVDPQRRMEAERALAGFSDNSDSFPKCMLMLERGSSPYTQLVATTTLLKLVSKQSSNVSLQQRLELSEYLVNYLANRPKLPTFVVNSMCQLFARLVKLGWFDFAEDSEFVFRNSVEDILKMIQGSAALCNLGVQLLAHIVAEMNEQTPLSSISKHRKVAASFRDVQLFPVFQLAVQFLQTAMDSINKITLEDENQMTLISHLLELAHNCLTFDFIGSVIDDTADDNVSVQVPTAWRIVFVENSIVKLFYGLYGLLPSPFASSCLACLVQLCSIRRTIFNNTERQQFLATLVSGAKVILENPQGLSEQANYHEFCRLVARMKSNYQLTELIKVPDYEKVIRMLAEFTVTSLQMHQFAANSIHYLLSFWQRMVSSMPYVKASEPHLLEQYAPMVAKAYIQSRITLVETVLRPGTRTCPSRNHIALMVAKAYIQSRITLVETVLREGMEDPLDDKPSLTQQLEQLAVIGRCEYEQTCRLVLDVFHNSATTYQQIITTNDGRSMDQQLQEGRLTWLVFIAGAAIGGRVAFSSSEDHDLIDGDLICRVLQLMRFTDERLPNRGCEKLELAYMWFLEQFRKIYISDQVQKTSKVYTKLSEVLGLSDESSVLGVFVRKIITNLKYWSGSEVLVEDTLTLLSDLSIGYTSVRKLVRLPEIQFLMNNHTSEHFSFLGTNSNLKTMKSRTTFYTALMRLLCVDIGEEGEAFEQFMAPLTNAMSELTKILSASVSVIVSQEEAKRAVIGLARDIRGIAYASNTKAAYTMLFDWIYPDYLALFAKAVEVWYADPNVTSPVLKLMAELCQNRSQRLQFEVSSPNAILLFKEASKLICAYGSRVLSMGDVPKEEMYRHKLKGITICFGILKAAMCGCYVNFGVFRLYGDSCLDDVLNVFVKLLVSIPRSDLLAYPKLGQNYYFLLEYLSQDHLPFISNLEPQIFAYMLETIRDGLSALDTMVCTCCCSCLDYIVSYLYRRVMRVGKRQVQHVGRAPEGDHCLRTLEEQPHLLRNLLSTILNAVMFEECRCQWSMSRPLLGLILLQEEAFTQIKMDILSSQPTSKQENVERCFISLMGFVEPSLSTKNKDRFTQNLAVFRRELNEFLKLSERSGNTATAAENMMS